MMLRRACALACVMAPPPASAQVLGVTVAPPSRDFGYFIGDTMTAVADIRLSPGTSLDRRSLPVPGAVAAALDVRSVAVTTDVLHVQVRVEYQTFVAPEEAMQIRVPGYTLVFRGGGTSFEAAVPYWSFYTSPFRHERAVATDPAVLRADHELQPLDLTWQRNALLASLLVAGCAFLVLARLRGWRPRFSLRRAPFARAVAQMSPSDRPAALLTIHRAFDATAGRSLLADDLEPFLCEHPIFAPLRSDIESFFRLSRATFFGSAEPAEADLLALAKKLRRAERMA